MRWLNGMVTNSIQDLGAGEGSYNFFLNAQGRIQGDGSIFAEHDHLLLETDRSQLANLVSLLDRFIIMDEVELSDVTDGMTGILLAGPKVPELLSSLELLPGECGAPGLSLERRSGDILLIRAYSPLVPRFEIWSDEGRIREISARAKASGATPCTPAALELLRIYEGTPRFGVDIRGRDLPQETGASRALHFAKGCYLGQEIVERIRSRGNVHRTFRAFRLQGDEASRSNTLSVDGKPVGELTSVAYVSSISLEGGMQIGLGYVRRDALEQGGPIQYEGGTALPVTLPFALPHANDFSPTDQTNRLVKTLSNER